MANLRSNRRSSGTPATKLRVIIPKQRTEASNPNKTSPSREAILKNHSKMVTLYSGSDEEVFIVHKDFACHYSPVLKAAFNSNFVEGYSQSYRLEDTQKETLHLLVNWIYTKKIDAEFTNLGIVTENGSIPKYDALIKLWVLADMLLIPELQNLLAKEMYEIINRQKSVPTQSLALVYARTAAESPLRRLFLDICVRHLDTEEFSRRPLDFPRDMLLDLATLAISSNTKRGRLMSNAEIQKYLVPEQ